MKDSTQSKILFWAVIIIMVIIMIALLVGIYKEVKAESIEALIDKYPFWAVSTSGDSTFQTVQIIKYWRTYPNGQRTTIGYKVLVDSLGICIYEEKPVWFLIWAVHRALSLRNDLAKVKQKGD